MSGETAPAIDVQVWALAAPKVREALESTRAAFMEQFGEFVEAVHKDELEEHFRKAGECKLKAMVASDPDQARQYAEAAELHMDAINTLGLGAKIVTKAKTDSVLKATAGIILDTLGDVALSIIKTIVSGLVSGTIKGFTGGGGAVVGDAIGGIADAAGTFLDGPN